MWQIVERPGFPQYTYVCWNARRTARSLKCVDIILVTTFRTNPSTAQPRSNKKIPSSTERAARVEVV